MYQVSPLLNCKRWHVEQKIRHLLVTREEVFTDNVNSNSSFLSSFAASFEQEENVRCTFCPSHNHWNGPERTVSASFFHRSISVSQLRGAILVPDFAHLDSYDWIHRRETIKIAVTEWFLPSLSTYTVVCSLSLSRAASITFCVVTAFVL